jgi:hypothetical protein
MRNLPRLVFGDDAVNVVGLSREGDGKNLATPELDVIGGPIVLVDILIALLITAVAIVLGITVHPLLFFILVLAVLWLVARHWGGARRAY